MARKSLVLLLLACAGLVVAAGAAHAQVGTARQDAAPKNAASPATGVVLGWPDLFRNAIETALAPAFAGVEGLLHPAAITIGLTGGTAADLVASTQRPDPDAAQARRDAAPGPEAGGVETSGFALQRRFSTLGYTDVGIGTSLLPFRIPWLLTPESAIRAMPTLTLAMNGSMRVDFLARTIGGRNGASVAFIQLAHRF